MKIDPQIVAHYAQAFFNVTQKRKETQRLLEDARSLLKIMPASVKMQKFLESPQIPTAVHVQFIEKVLRERVGDSLLNLILLLLRRHRIHYLKAILHEFERLVEAGQGIFPAEVITAAPVETRQRPALQRGLEHYTQHKLHIRYRVDPKVLGGVVFRYQDLLIDGSIQTRLHKIRRKLLAAKI